MFFIVVVNDKIDEVFSTREAAEHHAKQMQHKWSLTKIIEKEIKDI